MCYTILDFGLGKLRTAMVSVCELPRPLFKWVLSILQLNARWVYLVSSLSQSLRMAERLKFYRVLLAKRPQKFLH
jgi:hypothetical protein